jgi:hypothetical protein
MLDINERPACFDRGRPAFRSGSVWRSAVKTSIVELAENVRTDGGESRDAPDARKVTLV